jgi:endonuclease G
LIFALLLLLAPSCRQAASQSTAVTEDNDSLKWVRDIDIPSPLPDSVAEQILYRKAYIVSYNKDRLQPNWVAWHLTAEHVDGNVPRPNLAFHEDKDVPEPKAYHWDYRYEEDKHIDRGHMCPAGDNKWDKEAMYESFLMTNICPQHKALNSGIWNTIEKRCREWAKEYGDIYIVCGPIFMNREHDSIGEHHIPKPEAFFKVVACLNPEHPWGIGYICRNNEGTRKRDLYTNSISEVERITGLTFFPNIDEAIKAKVKDTYEE